MTCSWLIIIRPRPGMLNPSHPGESILHGCLGDEMNASMAAELLGVPRAALDEVLAGRAPVTPDLARRLEKAGWSSTSFWLRRQAAYDKSKARSEATVA